MIHPPLDTEHGRLWDSLLVAALEAASVLPVCDESVEADDYPETRADLIEQLRSRGILCRDGWADGFASPPEAVTVVAEQPLRLGENYTGLAFTVYLRPQRSRTHRVVAVFMVERRGKQGVITVWWPELEQFVVWHPRTDKTTTQAVALTPKLGTVKIVTVAGSTTDRPGNERIINAVSEYGEISYVGEESEGPCSPLTLVIPAITRPNQVIWIDPAIWTANVAFTALWVLITSGYSIHQTNGQELSRPITDMRQALQQLATGEHLLAIPLRLEPVIRSYFPGR